MESTFRVLMGTAQEPSVTSNALCQMVSTTNFVRIESRSIAPSARRCTSLRAALIDLMEPISAPP